MAPPLPNAAQWAMIDRVIREDDGSLALLSPRKAVEAVRERFALAGGLEHPPIWMTAEAVLAALRARGLQK